MIPLKLTIEGIYSYQKRQTIDFTSLVDAGIFGIFGGVGSGKSSILESISYALYGETERLNLQDKRSYNMMNLKSDRAYIEFDFINHSDKTYRVTREFKRNSKRFDDIRTPTVQFYEKTDDSWLPLEHCNAEELVGLNYRNFKRTIIIPQGQFKEFLELGGAARTTMMQEIFGLDRFDLYRKTSSLYNSNKSELDQIEGQLKEFESINREEFESKKINFELLNSSFQEESLKHQLLDKKIEKLEKAKENFEKLNEYKLKHQKLSEQKNEIDNKSEELNEYERVQSVFKLLISDFDKASNEKSKLLTNQTEKQKLIGNLTEQQILQNEALKKILPYFETLVEKRKKEADFEYLIQISEHSQNLTKLKERIQGGKEYVENTEKELTENLEKIKNLDSEIERLKEEKFDSKLLFDLGNWYAIKEGLDSQIADLNKKLEEKKSELSNLENSIEKEKIDILNYELNFQESNKLLDKQEDNFIEQKSDFEVQKKMADYASKLYEGSPCPLCGSTEHPHIANIDDVSGHLKLTENELERIKTERLELVNKLNLSRNLVKEKNKINTEIEEYRLNKNALIEESNRHLKAFLWNNFEPNDKQGFENKKNSSIEIEAKIEKLNKELAQFRKSGEEIDEKHKKYSKALDELKRKESELDIQISTKKSLLKSIDYEEYMSFEVVELSNKLTELRNKNNEIEKQHQQIDKELIELDKNISTEKTLILDLENRISSLENSLKNLENEIDTNLKKENFADINSVLVVLNKNLDRVSLRKEIDDFKLQFELLKDKIRDLEVQLENEAYDEAIFEQEKQIWQDSLEQLETTKKSLINLEAEVKRLNKALIKKSELESIQENLKNRDNNLKTISNLFKGAGFVQYVSSIYLSQLCDHANERFHRMTRNQLSLKLNENNDFEIIDYLNEGRSRSVKTLSGGQAFQVSLSLALALAESVQSHAKAKRNFFFIDEGFGTQDVESVNIVFDTLLSLNKENKIVGVISHVEELKERIPHTLTVLKDEERGSLIYFD